MLYKTDYPVCEWNLVEKRRNIELKVKASPDKLTGARLWKSVSDSRDFRKATWTKSDIQLNARDRSVVNVSINYPKKGFQAFYVDLVYKDPHGDEYTVSTRTYVSDNKKYLCNNNRFRRMNKTGTNPSVGKLNHFKIKKLMDNAFKEKSNRSSWRESMNNRLLPGQTLFGRS